MFFVYIIESSKTGKWYYGHTNHLERRLKEHNSGLNTSTKGRGPWQYIFQRSGFTLEQAVEFEKHFKRLRNKVYIKKKYLIYFLHSSL